MFKPHFSTTWTLSSLILLLSFYSTSTLASNDWSKPCFNGTCSYDLPNTPSGPSGTLKIWGSNTAIADITTAGGWQIIGCDPDKEEQDIKIVCKGIDIDGDGDNDGCAHLFATGGNSSTSTITRLPVPTGTVVQIGDDEDQRANGKIVRLPPECGKQAFGRIANAWTDTDQTLPPEISKRLVLPLHRRTKHHHKIKGLTIDTQFQKTDRSKFGDVKFAIVGANVPGAKASGDWDINERVAEKRNFVYSRVFRHRRGFGDFIDDVGGAISDGAGAVGGAISDGVGAVGEVISDGAGAVGGAIADGAEVLGGALSDGAGAVGEVISDGAEAVGGAIADGAEAISDGASAVGGAISDGAEAVGGAIADSAEVLSDALSGPQQISKTFSAPFDISKTFTVFETSIKCSAPITNANNSSFNPKVGVNGKLKVDVEADVHGNVDISVFASGSLTELRLDKFELSTSMNADLNGAIILSAGVGGSIESGNIKLFEVGIPGLDFPGIFSIGPTFQINGNAKASLNIDTDMRIGVAYHIDNVQFDFPDGGKKSGSFSAGDTPLQISAQPSSSAKGTVEAHLIPSLNVGINAFGGVAKAEVFVNLDASASVSLTVDATGPVVEGKVNRRESMVRGRGAIGAYYFNDKRTPVPEPFGFGDIVDGIKDGAKKAAGAVKSGAKKAAGAVESGAKKVVDGAKKAVESGEKKVGGAVKEGAKKIEEGAKKVGGAVKEGAEKVEEGAKKVVKEGAKKVEEGAKKAGKAVKEGAEKVEEGAKKAGKAVKEGAEKVEEGAKKAGKAVKEGAEKVEEGAKKVVKAGAKKVEEGAKKAGKVVKEGAERVEEGAKKAGKAVKEGAEKVEEGAKKIVKEGAKKVEEAGKAVKGGAKKVEEGAKKIVKEGAEKVENGVKKAGQVIKEGAEKVEEGFKEGAEKVEEGVEKEEEGAKKGEDGAKKGEESAKKGGAGDDVTFGGCVEVSAGLSVNIGADASFFGLFDPLKKIPLFEKQFSLLKKCFGDQKRRVVGRGLTCNGVNVSGVVELANEVVRVV